MVDTVGLNTKITLDQVGMPHSEQLRVVTRIRRLDAQQLEFAFTFDDPKAFTHPWDRKVHYKLAKAGDEIYENICENSNVVEGPDGEQIYKLK